jgi:hypothetical protein
VIAATAPARYDVDASAIHRLVDALRPIVLDIAARSPRPRRERLSGIHNPWGHAAVLATAWPFLDLCESAPIVHAVTRVIGPDVLLWDSELHLAARSYVRFVEGGREGLYWPATPLAGAIVLVALARPDDPVMCFELQTLAGADLSCLPATEPLYVIRYMPATSKYVRDPSALANYAAMEADPLINYTTRPLWLVAGEDRAGNDLVTGFSPAVPRWAGTRTEQP